MFKTEGIALGVVQELKSVLHSYDPYIVPDFTNAIYLEAKEAVWGILGCHTSAVRRSLLTPEYCRIVLERAADFLNARPSETIEQGLLDAGLLDDEVTEEAAG